MAAVVDLLLLQSAFLQAAHWIRYSTIVHTVFGNVISCRFVLCYNYNYYVFIILYEKFREVTQCNKMNVEDSRRKFFKFLSSVCVEG